MTQIDASEDGVRAFLTAHLARVLKRPPERIDPDAAFPALGLDSAEQLFLVAAIEDWSGLDLPSDLPLDHPTPASLARDVAARLRARLAKPR